MNRRDILKIGTLSAFGGILSPIMAKDFNTNKSCIFIYLHGGISQCDFTSPIMEAPVEFRTQTGIVKHNNGLSLGGTFEKLITKADKFSIVRSFSHIDNNHNSAQAYILTSHPSFSLLEGQPQKEPAYGSLVSAICGANSENGIPSYIKLSKLANDKSAWLGATHIGYEPDGELDMKVSLEKFQQRLDIVNEMEKHNSVRGQYLSKSWSDLRNQAAKVISGNIASSFKINEEKPHIIQNYKADKIDFCKNLLIARRLVQNGCRFVSIANGSWDHHGEIVNGFRTQGPPLDHGIAALLEDLNNSGILKDCLVIIATEFGRTSKINATAGRDHQAGVTPLILAGGNYNHGRIIGTHDDRAMEVTSKKHDPFDLCATIFDHFGFKKDEKRVDNSGRPRYLLEKGDCIL